MEQQESIQKGVTCVRLKVVRWDDDAIYGQDVERSSPELLRVPLRPDERHDWRYLLPLLEVGSRLNLVAGLLILEPDYLVDISAIAACFESYAESPLVHLLNKLRPSQSTEAIVLGNLASLLLDEEVHAAARKDDGRPYADIVRDFFKGNAVSLLTADVGRQFHEQARAQQANIRRAIRQDLPGMSGDFDARDVMLEPSFFSEMLGLQGRMDFLQLDYRVLIEQKSGKGAFPQPDPTTPVPQLKHYVQLLLYMALLQFQFLGTAAAACLQGFLLYSKYLKALQPVNFSEDLLLRAIRLRNGIAHAERRYAREGLGVLLTLTPEMLNERRQQGKFWQQYVRPQLAALLEPIHTCSPLEQAYYLRFQRFVATEHLRAKVGTGVAADAGFSARWRQTLDEKQAAGDICAPLRLLLPAAGDEGRVDNVVLGAESSMVATNLRKGDIVILYPYAPDREPDCRQTMVFRGSIAEMDERRVVLALRAAQTDAHVFLRSASQCWAIEHDFMEASFAPLYRGMHAFLSAPQQRRDLLLLQRPPRVDEQRRLRLDHGAFNELALRVRQALELFLIIGPPGTGKTSFGLMTTLREELVTPGASVLLLSYTNRAVDEVCSKLEEDGLDYLRVGSRLNCAPAFRPHLLDERVLDSHNLQQVRQQLLEARVVVGTTSSLSSQCALLGLRGFTLAIVDEASQILEPHLMSLLAAQRDGEPSIQKLVMIGDHKQLPAVVQQSAAESRVEEETLRDIGLTDCRLSLFERLLKRYARDPRVTFQLTRQGRMHPEIARFPNVAFYGGRLCPVPLPHQEAELPEGAWPRVAFVDVVPKTVCDSASLPAPEKVNLAEAEVIARLTSELWQRRGQRLEAEDLGVIVPYRNQIAAVRSAIAKAEPQLPLDVITIDTVERFQGSQRDVIIYGFTVQQPAQLDFLTELSFEEEGHVIDRKLNVAMTRAREHLLLVGNAALLRQNALFANLIDVVDRLS